MGSRQKEIFKFLQERMFNKVKDEIELDSSLLEACDEEKGAKVNVQDDNGWTPLLVASSVGEHEMIRKLISLGAEVQVSNKFGSTPLHLVASKDFPEACKVLIENGAKVCVCDSVGQTPLHRAAGSNSAKSLLLLLDSCEELDLDIEDKNGDTPLNIAAIEGHKNTVVHLLKLGANPNIFNKDGKCASDYIMQKDVPAEILETLVQRFKEVPGR